MKLIHKISFIFSFSVLLSCASPRFIEKTEKFVAADQLLQKNAQIKQRYTFEFRGKKFIGLPNVYSPKIFPGANKQKHLDIKQGETFLEIGSGTGVFSVMAALDAAARVVATDINPDAVQNTRENARLHKVDKKLVALQGDMFAPLSKADRFDTIFFNISFCHRSKSDVQSMLSKSLYDPEHDLLYRYLKEGPHYLKENGRMLLGYSTTHGDVPLMLKWAKENGLTAKLINKEGDETKDFVTVELYEFTRS